MFNTVYSDREGRVRIADDLTFMGRSGSAWLRPDREELMPLPQGSSLVMMPGYYPVGMSNDNYPLCLEDSREGYTPVAMAALLPQGFTRTFLPAAVAPKSAKEIPILGYTAVAGHEGDIYAAAVQTDEDRKWNPRYYNTEELEGRIKKKQESLPGNRILQQLTRCSCDYSCFTAQNIFYERWEGGIPTTPSCNAQCVGCISRGYTRVKSPQERLDFVPEVSEIVGVGLVHLQNASEAIISFGQGCEGEPALSAERIAPAVKLMRGETDQGSINLNTNAGYTAGIQKITDAGLDSMRVTMLSARAEDYTAYHRPQSYMLKNVEQSIAYAVENGVYVSLNLLTMPGFTDTEEQIEATVDLVERTGVKMIQLRNLNLDPNLFFDNLTPRSDAVGILTMIEYLRQSGITVASYSHPASRGKGLI
ncbi:MAG: radical SAM protein [Ignavibacteriales bacterium]